MRHLNYSHLLYFHTVAKEGSVTKASQTLHLTPQTISGQLKLLEDSIGKPLFDRIGRGLVLTETGRAVNQYADAIFSLGTELSQWLSSQADTPGGTLNVGIVNSIPKLIAHEILHTTLDLNPPLKMVCKEDTLQDLLGDLAIHKLDLVLSDRQIPIGFNVKAFNHQLGESTISFYASDELASQYEGDFPASLDGAPMLMPMSGSALRRSLNSWLDQAGLVPRIVAEFDDSALLKAFGESGAGIFAAPDAIKQQLQHTYHVRKLGSADSVTENYYAISPERVLKQPAILRITQAARKRLSNLS
jgi:LysR family transcriptional activator of nhaA